MSRLETLWQEVRSSLWFLPALMTTGAVALAIALVRVDRAIIGEETIGAWWIFGGGAEGARSMLSAIASSIITVTGVIFSITIVALQLASSQFTPRVLRQFTADRVNQTVLGVLIGTFTYALLVLRAVRVEDGDREAFVPALAVTGAMVLTLVSVASLIFFISHISRSIQASSMIDRITRDTLDHIETLFPERIGEPEPRPPAPALPDRARAREIRSVEAGYLQAVDEDALVDLAGRRDLVVEMAVAVGEFVLPGEVLAWGWPAHAFDARCRGSVRDAFVLGHDRTPYQDVEFGIVELMDIAVKALSPSINDPTTAMVCIDRLSELLVTLGTREMPSRFRTGPEGKVHFIARRTSFDRAVEIAFGQIRHYGSSNPAVAQRMLRALDRVAALVPAQHHRPLVAEAVQVLRAAEASVRDDEALDELRRTAQRVLARSGGDDHNGPPVRRAG